MRFIEAVIRYAGQQTRSKTLFFKYGNTLYEILGATPYALQYKSDGGYPNNLRAAEYPQLWIDSITSSGSKLVGRQFVFHVVSIR